MFSLLTIFIKTPFVFFSYGRTLERRGRKNPKEEEEEEIFSLLIQTW